MKAPVRDASWGPELQALHEHDMREIWDPGIACHIWNQYHNQLDLYFTFAEGDRPLRILDVGCAQGTLALKLAERGHDVTAVDIRQEFLDYARSRYESGKIEFRCANVLESDLDGQYDLIFANQIIEHLVYPHRLVRRLAGVLAPGGRLVVTTPNGAYLKNDLPSFGELGDVARWEGRQHTADADGHFFAYRPAELRTILLESGLSRVEVSVFETPFISGHMKVRHVHGLLPVSLLRACDRILLAIPGLGARLAHQLLGTGVRP